MSHPNTTIAETIDAHLASAGFRRKGQFWYRPRHPFCVVFELQKASWGDSFFVNFGVAIDFDETGKVPPRTKWDVYGRVGGPDEAITRCLDLEVKLSASERRNSIEAHLVPAIMSLVSAFSSEEGAKMFVARTKGFLLSSKGEQRLRDKKPPVDRTVSVEGPIQVDIRRAKFHDSAPPAS